MSTILNSAYWNNRYQHHETGWDIGNVSTPLKEYIDQLKDKHISILIPGCGNSYEAAYLLQQGFTNVTLVDIAPLLVQQLLTQFSEFIGQQLTVIAGDFFRLQGQYDLVLEQTFFCALDPSLRPSYVKKMHSLLAPGGKLAGVLFNRDFEGGPPFGGHIEEYRQLFSQHFTIHTLAPCYNSIKPREGAEAFVIAANL
ncbi:MAG: methyltransferase domain-containing protein [Chitinophagaceae bacterium]